MSRSKRLASNAKRRLFDIEVTHIRYPVSTGADKGDVDFSATPTTLTTVKAHRQLASSEAVVNANLEVKQGQWQIWAEPLNVSASTDRLVINSVEYEVLRVLWSDSSHTQAIIEER